MHKQLKMSPRVTLGPAWTLNLAAWTYHNRGIWLLIFTVRVCIDVQSSFTSLTHFVPLAFLRILIFFVPIAKIQTQFSFFALIYTCVLS